MRTPPPFWFLCCLCGVLMALLVCLLLFPATAQHGTVQIGQMTFRF